MAGVGRKRKPHAIKKLEGSRWADTDSEPNIDPAIPTCPQHLNTEARREWKRITPLLKKAGLLTLIDRAAVSAYCSLWSRLIESEETLKKFGTIIKSPSGFPMVNPALQIANTSMKLMGKYLTEFGMSPSSRPRVAISGDKKDDDSFGDLLS